MAQRIMAESFQTESMDLSRGPSMAELPDNRPSAPESSNGKSSPFQKKPGPEDAQPIHPPAIQLARDNLDMMQRTKSGIRVSSPHFVSNPGTNPNSTVSSPLNSINSKDAKLAHQITSAYASFKRNPAQHRKSVFVIGVAGGTASGKTTVCDNIMQRLHDQCVVMLSQDSFYRGLTEEEKANVKDYNFDHPDAFDTEALMDCITKLKNRLPVEVPEYDFTTHSRSRTSQHVAPADVVIIEGILVLHMEDVRKVR